MSWWPCGAGLTRCPVRALGSRGPPGSSAEPRSGEPRSGDTHWYIETRLRWCIDTLKQGYVDALIHWNKVTLVCDIALKLQDLGIQINTKFSCFAIQLSVSGSTLIHWYKVILVSDTALSLRIHVDTRLLWFAIQLLISGGNTLIQGYLSLWVCSVFLYRGYQLQIQVIFRCFFYL